MWVINGIPVIGENASASAFCMIMVMGRQSCFTRWNLGFMPRMCAGPRGCLQASHYQDASIGIHSYVSFSETWHSWYRCVIQDISAMADQMNARYSACIGEHTERLVANILFGKHQGPDGNLKMEKVCTTPAWFRRKWRPWCQRQYDIETSWIRMPFLVLQIFPEDCIGLMACKRSRKARPEALTPDPHA